MAREILFDAKPGKVVHHGQLVYRVHEWSLDFEPGQIADCSVSVQDIEVEFDSVTRCASQISGYHPHIGWKKKALHVPEFFPGSLVLLDNSIEDTDIVRLKGTWEWETFYDPKTGWMCVGYDTPHEDDTAVEFATGIIAVVNQHHLKALWGCPAHRRATQKCALGA